MEPGPFPGSDAYGTAAAPVASASGVVGADVLVVVQYGNSEIYDPSTQVWTQAAPLPNPRFGAVAASLANGNVLVTSGVASGYTGDTEIYHPTTNAWTQAAPLPDPRASAVAASLGNGDVLVTSGRDAVGVTGDTEIYDPSTNTWTQAAPLPVPRFGAVAASIENGDALVTTGVTGGGFTADTEIYDLATNTWTQAAALPDPRYQAVAAPLGNGNVLVSSGFDGGGNPTGDTELYDPVTNTWLQSPALPVPRSGAVAATLPGGGALVTGGAESSKPTSDSEMFSLDPSQTSVSCTPSSVLADQATTCTATVTDTTSSPTSPTGTIRFYANRVPSSFPSGSSCALSPMSGSSSQSSCQVSFNPGLGQTQDTVTGYYQPEGGFAAGHGASNSIAVSARRSTTTLSCQPSSTPLNTATQCTAMVSDVSTVGQPQPPTGIVTFAGKTAGDQFNPADCTLSPGSGATASCTVSYTPTTTPGKHVIAVRYAGDSAYQGSTGNTTVTATGSTAN